MSYNGVGPREGIMPLAQLLICTGYSMAQVPQKRSVDDTVAKLAIVEVRDKHKSYRATSNALGLGLATVWRLATGVQKPGIAIGRKPVLSSSAESGLILTIRWMNERAIGLTLDDVLIETCCPLGLYRDEYQTRF